MSAPAPQLPSYVIVSPVKDEAANVAALIESMLAQTHLPALWVIVDDGSSDATRDIVRRYLPRAPWIRLLESGAGTRRDTGRAEAAAFNRGFEVAQGTPHELIVKLDGDLRLPPDYFARIAAEFARDPKLGICSGVYRETHGGQQRVIAMPHYHAAGASKVYRRTCLAQIGGISARPGWDSADEIKALYLGWTTYHLADLVFDHMRPEGSAMGWRRTNQMHGEIFYRTGGSPVLFVIKALRRTLTGKPPVLAGVWLVEGWLRTALSRDPRMVSPEETRFHRRLQWSRVFGSDRAARAAEKASPRQDAVRTEAAP